MAAHYSGFGDTSLQLGDFKMGDLREADRSTVFTMFNFLHK